VGGEVTDPAKALETSTQVFNYIGWAGIASGVVLFLLAYPLKRMSHGVK
jgi:POT family proton-dependent oligopeptide transporter